MSSITSTNNDTISDIDDNYILDLFKKRCSKDKKDTSTKSVLSDESLNQKISGIFTEDELGQYDRREIFFGNVAEAGILYEDSDEEEMEIEENEKDKDEKNDDFEEDIPVTSINLLKFCQANNPSLQIDSISRTAFQDQFKPLFNNQKFSDICFIARDESTGEWKKIYAHKLILKTRSEYFRTMLKSGMVEASNYEVKIESIPYDILLYLLEYLYTGVLKITFEKSLLILSAANQFQMQDVKQIIAQYFSEIIDPSIACLLYEESFYQNSVELKDLCLTFIEKNPERVVNSSSFQNMTKDMVLEIIRSDFLVIDEFQLFRACVAWSKNQAKLHGENPETDHAKYFAEIVDYIRFPQMKPTDLRDQIEKNYSSLVPKKYILEAYRFYTIPKSVKSHRAEPRHGRASLKFSSDKKSSHVILSNNDLTAKITTLGSRTVCADVEWTTGVHYFEVHIDNTESTSNIMVGVADKNSVPYDSFLSHFSRGWAIYAHGGEKYHNCTSSLYTTGFSTDTTVGVEVNMNDGTLRFFINGINMGIAFSNLTGSVSPAVTLYNIKDQVTISPNARVPEYSD